MADILHRALFAWAGILHRARLVPVKTVLPR